MTVITVNTATPSPGPAAPPPQYAPASERNILSQYRSYTYNFTIGAVPATIINDSKDLTKLDNAVDDFHILDSAGKMTNNNGGISETAVVATSTNRADVISLVRSFNEATDNPGFFDMYMDDLTIESIIGAGSPQGGSSAATNVEFTVIEPYSINGFIQSLQVAAVAAGYEEYIGANFCLRVRFLGHRDNASLSDPPEIVPKSTRYFIFSINAVEINISENGSKYRVAATPFNQRGLGRPNVQLGDINAHGTTVQQVLADYFKQLNESSESNAREAARGRGSTGTTRIVWNKYEISAPALVPPQGQQDVLGAMVFSPVRPWSVAPTPKMNDIVIANAYSGLNSAFQADTVRASADNVEGARNLGTSPPPASSRPTVVTASFPFPAGQQIHESISSLVRDSEYVRKNVLQIQLPAAKSSSTDPTVIYFTIRMEVEIGDKDDNNNALSYIYRYVLEPYRMSYLNIPTQEQGTANHQPILDNIKREFNYLFTGKNTDVLKFDLKFDNLYYTGLPKMFGNTPTAPTASVTAGPINQDTLVQPPSTVATTAGSAPAPVGTAPPPMATDPRQNTFDAARSGLYQNDPYHKMAWALHQHIIDAVDKVTGDLEIIGDPYFFVTGTSGMLDLYLDSVYETTTGEAPVTQGDLMIYLTFRNPIDISSGGKPSLAVFNPDLVPWSGIYKVTQVKNSFKDGVFTQILSLIRLPGQVLSTSEAAPASNFNGIPSSVPGAQVTRDSAPPAVLRTGILKDAIDFGNFFNRGGPSVGLPGVPADFTGSFGRTRATFLTRVSGVASTLGSQLGISAGGIVDTLENAVGSAASSFNISPSALNGAATNASAAAINAAGGLMQQAGNIQDAAVNLASDLINQASAIGDTLKQDVVSAQNLAGGAVGGAGAALEKLQNPIITDPTGIASRLGIDPAAVSGLGKQLASKVTDELNKVAELVPANTNLAGLVRSGVVFRNMTGSELPNLPPLQPFTAAPAPIFDPARATITDAFGNIVPILNGQAAPAALTEVNKVRNSLGQASSGLETQFGSAAQAMLDKVGVANLTVNNVSASVLGVTSGVGSLAQNTVNAVMPASVGLGSAESNQVVVDSLVQSASNLKSAQVNVTLNSQLGSKQVDSPLTTLVRKSNNQGTLV